MRNMTRSKQGFYQSHQRLYITSGDVISLALVSQSFIYTQLYKSCPLGAALNTFTISNSYQHFTFSWITHTTPILLSTSDFTIFIQYINVNNSSRKMYSIHGAGFHFPTPELPPKSTIYLCHCEQGRCMKNVPQLLLQHQKHCISVLFSEPWQPGYIWYRNMETWYEQGLQPLRGREMNFYIRHSFAMTSM